MSDFTKHYTYGQQTAMKDAISRLNYIQKAGNNDPYMNKLKIANKNIYNAVGDIKRQELNALKNLENYLKTDTHSHKKEIDKLQKAMRKNASFKSW
jgi:hypothetical protein